MCPCPLEVAMGSGGPVSAFQQAVALHKKGRLTEAASLYRKILVQHPKHADVLHLLGVVELQRNHPSVAVEHISRAIKFDPDNPTFHFSLGNALAQLKRLGDAIASYDRALELRPSAEVFYLRGRILY